MSGYESQISDEQIEAAASRAFAYANGSPLRVVISEAEAAAYAQGRDDALALLAAPEMEVECRTCGHQGDLGHSCGPGWWLDALTIGLFLTPVVVWLVTR